MEEYHFYMVHRPCTLICALITLIIRGSDITNINELTIAVYRLVSSISPKKKDWSLQVLPK